MDILEAMANQDKRSRKGMWAPGEYCCKCHKCGSSFMGDKRAMTCAPCAYGDSAKPEEKSE